MKVGMKIRVIVETPTRKTESTRVLLPDEAEHIGVVRSQLMRAAQDVFTAVKDEYAREGKVE